MKMDFSYITLAIKNNRLLVGNVTGVIFLKGLGLALSLFSMPLYMEYFNDNIILGLWFTILSIINWIISFDLGLGNGLRNNLTIALANNEHLKARQIISSGYFILGFVTVVILVVVMILSKVADWNSFFNLSTDLISPKLLSKAVTVTLFGLVISFFLRLITSINAALQLPVINNVLTFLTSLLLVAYLFLFKRSDNPIESLEKISWAYCLIVNLPLLIVTFITFHHPKLAKCFPGPKYVDRLASKQVMSVGIIFFVLQLLFMVIFVTNEWFITKFFSPESSVIYQIYNRLFMVLTNIFMLVLVPVIAAITKAFAEGRYSWISNMKRILYFVTIAASVIQVILVLFLQPIVDFWLRENSIKIDYHVAAIFATTSVICIWVSTQSAIVTGLNKLNVQLYCFIFAVIFKIAFIIMMSNNTDDWSVVVLATGLCLLPYALIQPIVLSRYFLSVSEKNK